MGNVGSQYQSYGVTSNGTLRVSKNLCYFSQVTFPASVTSISNGITAFEKTTSTLLHCGGNLVITFSFIINTCFLNSNCPILWLNQDIELNLFRIHNAIIQHLMHWIRNYGMDLFIWLIHGVWDILPRSTKR